VQNCSLPAQVPEPSFEFQVSSFECQSSLSHEFVILSEVAAATEPKDLRLSSLTTGYWLLTTVLRAAMSEKPAQAEGMRHPPTRGI
jgi:hypothetical protein